MKRRLIEKVSRLVCMWVGLVLRGRLPLQESDQESVSKRPVWRRDLQIDGEFVVLVPIDDAMLLAGAIHADDQVAGILLGVIGDGQNGEPLTVNCFWGDIIR